jgi:hypothetical protein
MEPNPNVDESVPPPAEAASAEPSPAPDEPLSPSPGQPPASETGGAVEETGAEAAPPESSAPGEEDPLAALAHAAQRARLSPADEERASALLKEALVGGRAGVTRAIGALPGLPWIVGVNAVTSAWPELKPVFRRQLLAGLAHVDSDGARRVRLSLARGLFKQDTPTALKVAVGVAKEMRDKETGGLSTRDAQILASVFIGRAKPWIAQLPLADLKPAEADLLVHTALLTVFGISHAPVTQLGVLKWAAEGGRLAKLQPAALEAVTKGLSRWNGKWQQAIRKEVPELPEEIAAALKPARPAGPPSAEPEQPAEEAAEAEAAEKVSDEKHEDADEPETSESAPPPAERPERRPRPVYESKTVPSPAQGRRGQAAQTTSAAFNVSDALRQIEAHVSHLRSELHNAQAKLRQREEQGRRPQRPERAAVPTIEGASTPEEIARLNVQLEARNAELQRRIEELTADSEDRAASMGAHGDAPVADPGAQLRTLLALKLQEDYADFLALEQEAPDIVVQQHYRTVLRHVFEVLTHEGVAFPRPAEEKAES